MRTSVSKYQYAMRPRRSAEESLRRALPPGHTLTSLFASFRESGDARFFIGPGEARVIARDLERVLPGWTEQTVDAGDRLRSRVVRLLGADEVHLDLAAGHSGLLPWHRDVLHDYSWDPHTFYKQIDIPYGRADIKVPWELSRAQHLPTLGMAYAATGDPDYAAEVVTQIDDWIVANRPGYGVNWACTMDVAIRAVNWLWACHLVSEAPQVTDAFLTRLLASLLSHGRHIARNIERYEHGITTNHTLADYVGLLYLGLLLPGLTEASQWAREGREGVLACMRSQVSVDGVDYESSISYHRLVLEMFAGSYVLAERNGCGFPEDYRDSLERMFDFVNHYTRPDGLAPLVGDSDDGRLQILSRYFDWHPQDHRYLMAIGAVLFDREDLAAAVQGVDGAGEEAAWLLGPGALEKLSRCSASPRDRASRAFPESGRYVMRHQDHHAIVCTDEVGTAGMGNHKHNDILSFELSVAGVSMIVDPGSFTYTNDLASRDRFRSTSAHNTVVVDGVEQNDFSGAFGMRTDAEVRVEKWQLESTLDVLRASHTGYRRLADQVTHQRTMAFAKDSFAWLVVDRLLGQGEHTIESFIHLAPGGEMTGDIEGDASRIESALVGLCARAGVEERLQAWPRTAVSFSRDGVRILVVPLNLGRPSIREGWFAPRYGQRVPATVLRMSARLSCPAAIGYLILEAKER
jgi:Heparinase II/III-like protein/Heparinase II/III N-terminus